MPATEELYRFIHREAPGFAENVRAAAATSHNEAELRTRVAHHIQQLADQLGVRLDLREEYTLAEGQAAGELWGITPRELTEAQRSLAEMRA
jgi:hypothetical protein